MQVYDISPKPSRIWSIEVSSVIDRRRLARIISKISGVRMLQWLSWFSGWRDDAFCRFEIDGRNFHVRASWPEGSRFEISREPAGCAPEFLRIRDALIQSGKF